MPSSFYDWLAERFERRVYPAWLSILQDLPWAAAFTSALDPKLTALFGDRGREAEIVLSATETPRAIRSRMRPPLYYLFGRAGSPDPQLQPPAQRQELNTRRIRHALPILSRVLETATTLGLVIVDGFVSGRDWLTIHDLLGATGSAVPEQVLWFGGKPQLGADDAIDFDAAVSSKRILVDEARLGAAVSELRTTGRLSEFTIVESQETGVVTFQGDRYLETTPEERLRVEAVASIIDDSWTGFLPPLGPDAEYDVFRRFHGDLGGSRLLVEGVRRGFALCRDFEQDLVSRVHAALADHAHLDAPIIVHGQSGTGKSIALARVVVQIREAKLAAVLYANGRVPQPQEVSSFCEEAENAGAEATLIVCDANRDVDPYRDLLLSLRSLGRRVVVLGSRYRLASGANSDVWSGIEAPSELSLSERTELGALLARFLSDSPRPEALANSHILAFLYRVLPLSRARIAAGLSGEARATELALRARGRETRRPTHAYSQLAQKLIEAGLADDYSPLFNERDTDALEASDAAGRLVDLVMAAGSLNCHVPVNLLLRAVTDGQPGADLGLIAQVFRELDLFRWRWADGEHSELLVLPRLALEAELICRRRLGSAAKEAERLVELIRAVRGTTIDAYHERRFLLNLLQRIGDDGPRGPRYKDAYIEVARTLTELRRRFGVVHASLMLQESAFRRAAVRAGVADEDERLPLLEEARDAVQTALDGIASGAISAARRTRHNLQVERASLYGYLAYDRASRWAPADEVWSSYQAARAAIRQAVSVTDNYYPLDIGLWTPADMLKKAHLTREQMTELEADIYATLDQVDLNGLSPRQREKFAARQMILGAVLKNRDLTDEAYTALEQSGSTAGYYLRARNLAPTLERDVSEVTGTRDLSRAREAAEFLYSRLDKIQHDERCLSLLLECRWMAMMRRRPLRGQRQPLPSDDATRRDLLLIVHALNQAAGNAVRHVTRYLEAVLAWVIGDEQEAIGIFRELSRDTEYEDPGRVVRRHQLTDSRGQAVPFEGRVERQRSEGHWVIRVDGLKQTVDLLSRDFPREDVAYGRTLRRFGIAFNFIGPIADPMARRR